MSPELVNNKPYLGPPVDVWALGSFLYEVLHGKVAFRFVLPVDTTVEHPSLACVVLVRV